MSDRPIKEQFSNERLYALDCTLLFAVPKDEDPQGVVDVANMLLIPGQRREHVTAGRPFIDYIFTGDPVRMTIPAGGYDYEHGFLVGTKGDGVSNNTSYIYEQPAPRSADELQAEYSPNGDGEHPIHTRSDWRIAVNDESTSLGYWQWLADLLEEIEREE